MEKLALPINSFIEQVRNLFNKNIDFQNINQEIIEFTVRVDSDGIPNITTQFRSNLTSKVIGMNCINATNLTDLGTPVTGAPFVTFTQSSNIITVNNIKGLEADKSYQLRFLTIGESS